MRVDNGRFETRVPSRHARHCFGLELLNFTLVEVIESQVHFGIDQWNAVGVQQAERKPVRPCHQLRVRSDWLDVTVADLHRVREPRLTRARTGAREEDSYRNWDEEQPTKLCGA